MIYNLFTWQTWLFIMIIIIFIVWILALYKNSPSSKIIEPVKNNNEENITNDDASFIIPVNINNIDNNNDNNINNPLKNIKIPINNITVNEEYITPNTTPKYNLNKYNLIKEDNDLIEEEEDNNLIEEEDNNLIKEEDNNLIKQEDNNLIKQEEDNLIEEDDNLIEEDDDDDLSVKNIEDENNKDNQKFCFINKEINPPILIKKKDSILKYNQIKSIIEKNKLKTGEQIVCYIMSELLEDSNLERNIRPQFLTNPKTGRRLELDCWSSKYKIAAEYNGIQHYQFPSPFYSNYEDFEKQLYRDEIKRVLAENNGIKIITVPCTIDSYIFDENKTTYKQIKRSLIERYELIETYLKQKLLEINFKIKS